MDKEKNTGRKLGKKGLLGLGFAFVLIVALVIGGASGAFGLLNDSTSLRKWTTARRKIVIFNKKE